MILNVAILLSWLLKLANLILSIITRTVNEKPNRIKFGIIQRGGCPALICFQSINEYHKRLRHDPQNGSKRTRGRFSNAQKITLRISSA
jgi:hypothetical protein